MNPYISQIVQILQLIIQLGTIAGLFYGFSKFLSKPHDTLERQVAELQAWRVKVDDRMERGNMRFSTQDEANRVTQSALLALIDKEIRDCDTDSKAVPEELKLASRELRDYLTGRRHEEDRR